MIKTAAPVSEPNPTLPHAQSHLFRTSLYAQRTGLLYMEQECARVLLSLHFGSETSPQTALPVPSTGDSFTLHSHAGNRRRCLPRCSPPARVAASPASLLSSPHLSPSSDFVQITRGFIYFQAGYVDENRRYFVLLLLSFHPFVSLTHLGLS